MEKLWKMNLPITSAHVDGHQPESSSTSYEMRTFEDTRGDLKGVLGFTRHDELYSEIRPKDIQTRADLIATPHKSSQSENKKCNDYNINDNNKTPLSSSPFVPTTTGKVCHV